MRHPFRIYPLDAGRRRFGAPFDIAIANHFVIHATLLIRS